MKSELSLAKAFILDAVKNKYAVADEHISSIIEGVFEGKTQTELTTTEPELVSDLKRQTKTFRILRGLDQHFPPFSDILCPIAEIHVLVSGIDLSQSARSSSYVEDFGGVVPTRVDEIRSRLDELERIVFVLSKMKPQEKIVKAKLLAYVFSSIIRIHPFADGNGRVARFTVLHLLTCWRTEPFLVPKVRNNGEWKNALESAMKDSPEDLAGVFLKKLT